MINIILEALRCISPIVKEKKVGWEIRKKGGNFEIVFEENKGAGQIKY